VAVVLTLVTNKNKYICKGNNTKNTVQTIKNTVNTSTYITKTPTHTHIHTLQYKTTTTQDIYEGWNFNSGNYLFTTDTK